MKILEAPLAHFNERPGSDQATNAIDTIIIHSMYAKDFPDKFKPERCISVLDSCKVSAHYLISREGAIWQMVDEEKRAWHAGASKMPAPDSRENVNDFSIGIELIADENSAFTSKQYQRLAALIAQIKTRHPITSILGHEQIAPGRKTDPGANFDWQRLHAAIEKT